MSTNKMADTGSHMSNSLVSQKSVNKLKYTTFVGNGDTTSSQTSQNVSLQEAFKRYRKQRQKDIRKARRLRKRWELRQGDPDKMAALRAKFVAQAKKYIGVPYAKKYWAPESPEYKSKLFLDCCGLVRQVMRDLVEDFGFYIGPWNQAYMYDTLPITVENEKDMKPGDLVFISATYYNPKSKKQRHNMTHVEIWAGQGPKTIGSRWNNGKVQIWDSYRFTAKSYYDETYHFKSIDTWLMGICESHCSQHRWKKALYNPSKKSVFAVGQDDQEQDNSQDEAAGDDDDNVTDDPVASVRELKNQIADEAAARSMGQVQGQSQRQSQGQLQIQGQGQMQARDGAKSQMLSIISIQQNIPETDKVKVKPENKNLSDDGRVYSVTGQALPIISLQQNIGKKPVKAKKGKSGKSAAAKLKDTAKTTGRSTSSMATQTDKRVITAYRDKSIKPVRKCFESEDNIPALGHAKDEAVQVDACKIDNKDEGDSIGQADDVSTGLEVGVSDLNLTESEASSAAEISQEMINDALPFVNIKVNTDAEAMCAVDEDVSNKLDREEQSEKDITTKIAWVSLGTCPVCKTDLKSMKANKPCHETDDAVLEELGEDGAEFAAGMQRNMSGTCLSDEKLVGAEKVNQKEKIVADIANLGETECVCDNESIGALNVSNSALPKKTGVPESTKRTRTAEFESNMRCEGCHDVEPSGSDKSIPDQLRENIDNQSIGATSRNEEVSQSRSESSGEVDLNNPSEPSDEAQGTESAGKKSRGKKSPGGVKKETKLPTCSLPANMQPTFYIGGGNGVSLVEGPLLQLGWKRTTDKYDERFRLKWVECKSKINYGAFREGEQLVNHLPNSHLLTNKLGLLNSLKEYERVTLSTKGRLPRLKMSEFHPETYKLDEKGDRELFLEVYKDGEIWICKPIGMNQGKGIFLVRSREAINQMLEEREQRKQMAQKPGKPLANRIAQRYIMNPLLLDGRKFDVRAYMLVASTTPYLILYHKGYVRLSCHKYNENDLSMSTHLTNQFIQKKDPAYKDLKEDTAWSMDKFNDYVNEEIRPNSKVEFEEDWVYNTFTKQMQKIMIHCFNSVKHKIQCRLGFFDLFGLDFMVDTDMRVWLIEVNTNPALHCNCEALKEVIPGVVEESLYVAIECFEKSKKNLPLMPLQSLKHFTILYCGTRPNTIIPRQSRSVSPVKDNTSTASERLKPAAGSSRPRLLTQSTPLVAASGARKSIDKSDTHSTATQSNRSESNFSAKTNSSAASAKLTLPAIVTKSDDVKSDRRAGKLESRYTKSEFSATKTDHKLAKSDIIVAKTVNPDNATVFAKSGNKVGKDIPDNKKKDNKDKKETVENKNLSTTTSEEAKDTDKLESEDKDMDAETTENKDSNNDVDNREVEERLKEAEVEKKTEIGTKEEERRASVVDTLTRTQNSLNLATSALGKINVSLNQVGLTDSLLEEVRLKMTHADPTVNVAKPNSARVQRGRENLDRGN